MRIRKVWNLLGIRISGLGVYTLISAGAKMLQAVKERDIRTYEFLSHYGIPSSHSLIDFVGLLHRYILG